MPLLKITDLPTLASLIGQPHIKAALQEYASAWGMGGIMENLGLYGAPGMGKTEFGLGFAHSLLTEGIDVFYVNCKGTLNKTSDESLAFFDFCQDCLEGTRRGVCLVDEAFTKEASGSFNSELAAILSIAGGNPLGGAPLPLYGHGENVLTYKPRQLAFVLATWFPKKAAADIKTRFPEKGELRFLPYTAEELAEILKLQLARYGKKALSESGELKATPYAVNAIARSMRGTARQCEAICKYAVRQVQLNPVWHLSKNTVSEAMKAADVMPFGLSAMEVKILTALNKKRAGYTIAELGLMTGAAREDIQLAALYLQQQLNNSETPFQIFDSESGAPLTYVRQADGKEYLRAGALIAPRKSTYLITEHGAFIAALLTSKGFASN
jgi:Holliday junction resolvasome RuvABC ATP-dependent DNA helicase subunit